MAKQPYEVLLRFGADGKISGGHVVMAEYVNEGAFLDVVVVRLGVCIPCQIKL
jgi:hypothetical protein